MFVSFRNIRKMVNRLRGYPLRMMEYAQSRKGQEMSEEGTLLECNRFVIGQIRLAIC